MRPTGRILDCWYALHFWRHGKFDDGDLVEEIVGLASADLQTFCNIAELLVPDGYVVRLREIIHAAKIAR